LSEFQRNSEILSTSVEMYDRLKESGKEMNSLFSLIVVAARNVLFSPQAFLCR